MNCWSARCRGWILACVAACFVGLLALTVHGHPLGFGSGEFRFEGGEYRLELVLDSEAAEDADEQRRAALSDAVEGAVEIRFDGAKQSPRFRVLSLGSGKSAVDVVEYVGRTPTGATSVQIALAESVGDVALEVRSPEGHRLFRRLVLAGDETPTLSLTEPARPAPASADRAASGQPEPAPAAPERTKRELESSNAAPVSVWRMIAVGFEHILPSGLDHILFVLGLLLTSPSARRLVGELSVFTLAHSLTLALSAAGMVAVDGAIVEPLIALSIGALGAEYFLRLPSFTRIVLVFGFGLLHGLGFASSLASTGLAAEDLWRSVLGFNLGVELGQLSVAGAAWLAVRKWRSQQWFQTRVLNAAASALLSVGVLWAVLRFVSVY